SPADQVDEEFFFRRREPQMSEQLSRRLGREIALARQDHREKAGRDSRFDGDLPERQVELAGFFQVADPFGQELSVIVEAKDVRSPPALGGAIGRIQKLRLFYFGGHPSFKDTTWLAPVEKNGH